MYILGLQKTTLLDYPGHVAATIFTGGCNFCCPFCHNKDLVLNMAEQTEYSEEEIFAFLRKRSGILDGVCITGGEPTLQPDLEGFIRKVKKLGLAIKLDTNGSHPDRLRELMEENLLDYVAMDVKASPRKYGLVSGTEAVRFEDIEKSIHLLTESDIPYEFRTTVVKGLLEPEEFDEIGKLLQGCSVYYLQAYQDSEQVICPGFEAFTTEEMNKIAGIARKYIDKVIIRGVE